jgi:pSer/pThr/pTyr-binding forkhead associated (FHA) protein
VETAPEPEPVTTNEAQEPAETVTEPEDGAAPEPTRETVEEAAPDAETLDLERLPPIETGPPAAPEPEARPTWPWLLLGLLLIAGGVALHWRRRAVNAIAGDPAAAGSAPPASGTGDEPQAPAPELDRRLALRGVLADGTPIDVACPVSARAINVVIGRGATADLVLPSAAVSRQHARLNGTADALTVADLGSSNGTSVNGVPCLEGEILYLAAGDVLVVGDARLSVEIETPVEDRG